MNKYFTLTLCIVVFLLPIVVFGQTGGTSEDYNKLLQFLKGDGAFEKWFMEAFTKLDTTMMAQSAGAVMLGKSIGAFGALCYMGYLGWQMQEGSRPWEVTPMIRPTIIALILANWGGFCSLIQAPLQSLAEPGTAIFQDIEEQANDLRIKRFQKQSEILDLLIKTRAEEEAKQDKIDDLEGKASQDDDDHWYDVDTTKLMAPVKEWMIRMDFKFQKLLGDLMEAIGLSVLRVCVYLIFFIQKIWAYVLIILGPIAVGMSLVPGFENSFSNWVAKFININLYTFVSYTIINIGQQLIMSGYTMDIERMSLIISDGGVADMKVLEVYIGNNGMVYSAIIPLVAYVVTGIGILMVPSIADSIVSAGGAGIMSKGKAAGSAVASTGKAVKAATSGGAIAVADAAKDIAKSLKKAEK